MTNCINQPRAPYVALDRDGTLIAERHYLSDPGQVELLPGVCEALSKLRGLGCRLIMVTNQSGIGRGYFDEARLALVHSHLADLLNAGNVVLDGVFYCPHAPASGCACRKPGTAMLEKAAAELGLELARGFVIGDKACDAELGKRVGATSLLVRTGYGREFEGQGEASWDYIVDDLREAADVIERCLSA